MMRSVYIEAKINVPFSAHPQIVALQEANGVYLGYHHYERTAATRMTMMISEKMHEILIKSLTSKQSPLSIIVDGSTDAGQNHY